MKKFEYQKSIDPTIEDMDEYGKKGWELVSTLDWTRRNFSSNANPAIRHLYIFKREITSKSSDKQ